LTRRQKEFFEYAARQYRAEAVLVPGASRFRNTIIDKAMKRNLTPILEKFERRNILEVGCGVGRWTKLLSVKNSVVGVDISRTMITIAKESCRGKTCSFVVADVSNLPFQEKVFNLVLAVTVMQHLLERKEHLRALSDMARCSRSDVFIAEEMWSSKEMLLEKGYCPIRILPLKTYLAELMHLRFSRITFWGITPALITILLIRFLSSSSTATGGSLNIRFKSSRLISGILHFLLGVGMLSAVLAPVRKWNPLFSLHTVVLAGKRHDRYSSRDGGYV
jgi:SAM-dependent methyltransferase